MQRLRLNIRVSLGCGLDVESVGGYWLNHCDLYG